jgi:hypothetical protein
MIARLDSAYPPSPDTARAATAGGVRGWDGYISTAVYDGGSHFWLWHPWPREGFDYARLCGSTPIAYCSGWDNPVALKALAASWGVRLCLDVEGGIRADGPWVQAFLDASGAGLYGNYWVHSGRRAPFHVICASLGTGDPRSTWWDAKVARPPVPCGYQWWNTHTEFGVSVDRGNFDDWFAGIFSGDLGSLTGGVAPVSGQFQGMTHIEHVVLVGQDGHVHHGYRDAGAPGAGTAWSYEDLGAPTTGAADSAEFLCDAAVTLQVVRVRDPQGALWCRYAVLPGPWGAWSPLGNPLAQGAPAGPDGAPGLPGKDATTPTTGTIAGPLTVKLTA